MEFEDDYRTGHGDIEPDSDVDDAESESQLSQWLGELENYAKVSFIIYTSIFSFPGKMLLEQMGFVLYELQVACYIVDVTLWIVRHHFDTVLTLVSV